jgi:hypothetical protein
VKEARSLSGCYGYPDPRGLRQKLAAGIWHTFLKQSLQCLLLGYALFAKTTGLQSQDLNIKIVFHVDFSFQTLEFDF